VRTRNTAIAAVFLVLPALSALPESVANAQPATAQSPSPQDVQAAKDHFEKGSNAFKANNFAEALTEFKASYGKVASPNSHLYIARCMRELGQLVDAYLEFEKVTAEAQTAGEKYAQTGETAKVEHDELKAKIALVSVNVTTPEVGATLTIGGKEVPQDRWGQPFPAMPGSVDVRLEAPGKPAATQSVTAGAGESKDATLAFATGPTDGGDGGDSGSGSGGSKMSGMRIGAFAAAGVGVAGFVTFAVAGSMSNSTFDKLKENCGNSPCPPAFAGDVDKGKTQQTVANVGLIIGAVGVAAGATLFVLSLRKKPAADADAAPPTALMIGPGSLGVRGSF